MRTSRTAAVISRARIAGIVATVIAVTSMMFTTPAHCAPMRELIGKLAADACIQAATSPRNEAIAIVADAKARFEKADEEFVEAKRILILGGIPRLDVVAAKLVAYEDARKRAYALQIAYVAIRKCFLIVDREESSEKIWRTAKGTWNAGCTKTGDSKIVANASGSFVFNLATDRSILGEYREDGGPDGAIRGNWEERSKRIEVEGSASADLGDTVGAWKGVLGQIIGGRGEFRITKQTDNLDCVGQWTAQ